jgi:hypothetical protein
MIFFIAPATPLAKSSLTRTIGIGAVREDGTARHDYAHGLIRGRLNQGEDNEQK